MKAPIRNAQNSGVSSSYIGGQRWISISRLTGNTEEGNLLVGPFFVNIQVNGYAAGLSGCSFLAVGDVLEDNSFGEGCSFLDFNCVGSHCGIDRSVAELLLLNWVKKF